MSMIFLFSFVCTLVSLSLLYSYFVFSVNPFVLEPSEMHLIMEKEL